MIIWLNVIFVLFWIVSKRCLWHVNWKKKIPHIFFSQTQLHPPLPLPSPNTSWIVGRRMEAVVTSSHVASATSSSLGRIPHALSLLQPGVPPTQDSSPWTSPMRIPPRGYTSHTAPARVPSMGCSTSRGPSWRWLAMIPFDMGEEASRSLSQKPSLHCPHYQNFAT